MKGRSQMSGKQQLLTMLDLMGESEVNQILQFVKDGFRIEPKTWDDIEEDDSAPDEKEAIESYLANK